MTPKQRWYCFWVIIVVTVLLTAGLVWIAIHNPQASFEDLLYASLERYCKLYYQITNAD